MLREYHKWYSHRLGRDMELLVFGHGGPRVIVFPTRQGRFFDYENFGLVASLADRLERGVLQLFCVDSVDSESLYAWYRHPRDRITRHQRFEDYIIEEVVPLTSLMNPHSHLVAHGCSFGAFHSVNISFRHPDKFGEVVAFSGRYDLTTQLGPFADLFDGYYDEDIYFHTPNHFVQNLTDNHLLGLLRRMRIVLVIGADDPFYGSNMRLSHILNEKSVSHELYTWDGTAHRARYWRHMVRHYLVPY